uniref:Uncharacterized protein n=1 Tax=uncultured bacterium contig00048 TaxID=1181533 RepID=A0A806KSA1_9BACT|nr:hypothetical protein [uncultured bacterium contig00048]
MHFFNNGILIYANEKNYPFVFSVVCVPFCIVLWRFRF